MKKFLLIGLLIAATAVAQGASSPLPTSTYGSENGWQGYKDYKGDGFDVTVYFNVYDIVANPAEFTWESDLEMPAGDQYIYAYVVVNNDESTKDVGFFSLLDLAGEPVAEYLMHNSTSQDDTYGGIEPDPSVTDRQGEWGWSDETGYIEPGEWSWYLIFSSDHAPVKGDFKVEASEEGNLPIPEPATFALLGAAGVFAFAGRNQKRRPA